MNTLLHVLLACTPGTDRQTLEVGGERRHYLIHVPEGLRGGAPVVLAFHGGNGNARQSPRTTNLNAFADERGFVAVYPDALDGNWNDGRGVGEAEDLAFVEALIDEVVAATGADPERVYATGISNGGFFSMALACQLADRIAGAGAVAATQAADLGCEPSRPVPVTVIAGTEDPLVPYEGGQVMEDRGLARAAQDTFDGWLGLNGCAEEPVRSDWSDHADDGTTVHEQRACAGTTAEVRLLEVRGGGHTWPGGSQYLPKFVIGRVSREFDATDLLVDGFLAERAPAATEANTGR